MKARNGPGVRTAVQAASTSTCRTALSLAWRSARGAPARPGLADARVQPEIADQLAGAREATDVADRRDQRARRDRADAGDRHQPHAPRPTRAPHGRSPGRALRSRRRGSRSGADTRRPSRARRRAAPARPARRGPSRRRGRWPAGGPPGGASTPHGSRSWRACARAPAAAPRDPPAHRAVHSSGIHTASSSPAASSLASARASKRSVFTRAADRGVMRADDHHPRHVRREDPGDRPRVAGRPPTPPGRSAPGSTRTTPTPLARSRSGPPNRPRPPARSRPRRSHDAHPSRSP